MPELPEVETVRRGLAPVMEGARFRQVEARRGDLRWPLPKDVDAFVALCRDQYKLPIVGLMCIPPVDEEPALHFALLAKMAARNGLARLSMGMSADYETAVRLGATHVRVGSALFGTRPPLQAPQTMADA